MKTKVHRVTLLIVDHDDLGADDVIDVLENTRYASRCISPDVLSIETREVDWSDDHPLNSRYTRDVNRAIADLFGVPRRGE